ncbi:putative oxidoreductase [Dioscorea sansibarensis]
MDDHILRPFSIILILILLKLIKLQHSKIKAKTSHNSPPSPPTSLPILGHLHHLLKQKQPLHHSLSTLSSLHGPILSLRLGSRQALLVSSLSTATECFSSHNDIVFANRPHLFAGKHLGYNYTTIAWASYGPHWRNLRRLTTLELFSTLSLNSFSSIRRDEVLSLVKSLVKDNKKVVLKPKLFELTLNIMMRMIASKMYFGEDDDEVKDKKESERFRDIVEETFRVSGSSNLCDFIPFLRLFGYGRAMEKRILRLHEKRDAFLQELIDKRREKTRVNPNVNDHFERKKSVVDVLLGLQVDDLEYYTDDIIKGVVVMMLTAGTDTSAVTIEWAMSLLLNHPEVLSKVEEEIMINIGKERFVTELDLSNLSFLQCVIYETLRLKPPAPLIPAHESSEDCKVSGFHVSRGTMLLVNAWAMQRDPELWVEPNTFQPERWMGKGREERQKMLPFGIGRRSCPGEGLAMKVVGLTLAALIQCFEWRRVDDELVDLHEGPGLTMPKACPLVAV